MLQRSTVLHHASLMPPRCFARIWTGSMDITFAMELAAKLALRRANKRKLAGIDTALIKAERQRFLAGFVAFFAVAFEGFAAGRLAGLAGFFTGFFAGALTAAFTGFLTRGFFAG